MNVTQFPGGKNKNKNNKKNQISAEDKKILIEQFASMIDETEIAEEDLELSVSPVLFNSYLMMFPCFKSYRGKTDLESILEKYDEGMLDDAQDLAVEAVMDLVSDQYFEFSLKDAFMHWSSEDQAVFIQILGFHSVTINIKD